MRLPEFRLSLAARVCRPRAMSWRRSVRRSRCRPMSSRLQPRPVPARPPTSGRTRRARPQRSRTCVHPSVPCRWLRRFARVSSVDAGIISLVCIDCPKRPCSRYGVYAPGFFASWACMHEHGHACPCSPGDSILRLAVRVPGVVHKQHAWQFHLICDAGRSNLDTATSAERSWSEWTSRPGA